MKIEGRAVPWGSNTEEDKQRLLDWRTKIRSKVKAERENIKCNFDKFKITILFYMFSKGNQPDIDNLAKPVLDTLFTDKHEKEKYPKGALTDKDDNKVYELILKKQDCDKDAQRIEITIEEYVGEDASERVGTSEGWG